MPSSYPSFVATAGLTPEALDQLERDADRATALRAFPGTVAYAVLALGFSVATELGRQFPEFSVSMTVAAFAAGALRLWVLRRGIDRQRPVTNLVVWRAAAAVTAALCVGLYAVHVSCAIGLLGIGMTTLLMMMASTGLVAGLAHALAPRRTLMGGCATMLIGLPLCAVVTTDTPARFGVAALLALQVVYVLFLGHRLGVEYWHSAIAQAQLQTRRDDLLRSQRQIRDLVAKIPDSMGILSDDTIVFVNPAWTSSLQYEPSDLIGKKLEDLARPADVERLRHLLSTPGPNLISQEFVFLKKDGTSVIWEISPGEALDYEGGVARPVVARDVTERTRMRAQLLLSERLASIGTLAAGVAHEINNPLTYVLANLDYARAEIGRSPTMTSSQAGELAAVIAEAWEGAERVRIIVRDLKTFSRPDEATPKAIDLHAAIEFALKMTGSEVRRRARLVRDLSSVPLVVADESKLEQVLVNLVLNAVHAIPEEQTEDHEIRIATRVDEAGRILVEVSDTGVGISRENLSHIFDPFFTTKAVGVGTGLGLSICHSAVRSFGGEISVASEVGRGTTFAIRLLAAAGSDAPETAPSAARLPASRGRILVVDDEVGVGNTLQRSLGKQYELVVETDAPRALARLEAGEVFDLVLCDLMMPQMSGMDLFSRVVDRAPTYASKLLFMTGGACSPNAAAFLERVPNTRIEKPFDMPKLCAMVEAKLLESATG